MKPHKPALAENVTNMVIKGITCILCRVDARQLVHVPADGPLIIVTNHVNFLEIPVIYTRLAPRPVTGFSKIESWDSPFLGWLFDLWGVIPIHRGEPDKTALKRGLQALEEGYILTIAPEGTRSRDGCLLRGRPGVVMMALLSHAAILPVAHYGHESYKQNFRKLRRAGFHVAVGQPFKIREIEGKVTSAIRQQITDEIMYQLAVLLPERYRGEYSDVSNASDGYLDFINPAQISVVEMPNPKRAVGVQSI